MRISDSLVAIVATALVVGPLCLYIGSHSLSLNLDVDANTGSNTVALSASKPSARSAGLAPHLSVTAAEAAACSSGTSPKLLHSARVGQAFFCCNVHPLHFERETKVQPVTLNGKTPAQMYLVASNDIVSDHIMRTGVWETEELNSMVELMEEAKSNGNSDPLFLDIGSNMGWFSVNMAARGYRVIAFDAMRSNAELFRSTLCANPQLMQNITFINNGLSNSERACVIVSRKHNLGNGIIKCGSGTHDRPTAEQATNNGEYAYGGNVDMVRLDSYVQEPVAVMKIDVEGHERFVMKGGAKLFEKRQIKYILSEISGKEDRKEDGHLVRMLLDWGFKLSSKSFRGPYIDFVAGQEHAKLNEILRTDYAYRIADEGLFTLYAALA